MAKSGSMRDEETNCVTCGTTFGSRGAMEQHAGDVHVEGRGADARTRGDRGMANASGEGARPPSSYGSPWDQRNTESTRTGEIQTSGGPDRSQRGDGHGKTNLDRDSRGGQGPQARGPSNSARDSKLAPRGSKTVSRKESSKASRNPGAKNAGARQPGAIRPSRGRLANLAGRSGKGKTGRAANILEMSARRPSQPSGSDRDSKRSVRSSKMPIGRKTRENSSNESGRKTR
jgi:hypothetical protein